MYTSGYWILRRILKYSAPILKLIEARQIKKYGKNQNEIAPIFIVGLPRSGSTLIYQLITQIFDLVYIDNLMTLGREALFSSAWISNRLYKNKTHDNFSSTYGNTLEGGLHAPSEAGSLWYRWIPVEEVYIDENTLSRKQREGMVSNLTALVNYYNKPLLIKNLYFSVRIRMIRALFPAAKFIHVRRDPLYIAQSIYLSRIRNNSDPMNEWWSVKFPGYESLLGRPLEEQVANQVYELDKIIRNDLSVVDPKNVINISYEKLDRNFFSGPLYEFMGTGFREGYSPDQVQFRTGNQQNVDNVIFDRLEHELNLCYIKNQNRNR